MNSEEDKVTIEESHCPACQAETVQAVHHNFPEMRISGTTAEEAAEHLAHHLEAALDAVSDPSYRDPVQRAISDVLTYLDQHRTTHAA